ncbi:MAG TPA: hypothetical protein DIC19_05720 [Erysipelotrichaceae bacterium]|nr:hypothetical protein [Erysipelotrichaceae bacterium]
MVSEMKNKLLFISIFFIIFLSFNLNIFHTYDNDIIQQQTYTTSPGSFDGESQSLVIGSVLEYKLNGFMTGLGRLSRIDYKSSNWYENVYFTYQFYLNIKEYKGQSFEMYYSQLGGQGVLFRVLEKVFTVLNLDAATKYMYFQQFSSTLYILLLSTIIYIIMREFGKLAGVFGLASILLSHWVILISQNLYWVVWTWFLPMIVSMVYVHKYFNKSSKKHFRIYLLILFISVAFRALCGYEFISSILVSAVIPYLYALIKTKTNLRKSIGDLLKISITAISAFITVITAHLIYIAFTWKSFKGAYDFLLFVILKRTHGNLVDSFSDDYPIFGQSLDVPLLEVLNTQFNTSLLIYQWDNTTFILRFYHLFFIILIAFFFIIYLVVKDMKLNRGYKNLAISVGLIISFLSPITWFVLAKGHTAAHPHLIPILWYLPFLIFGMSSVGYAISMLDLSRFKIRNLNKSY